MSIVAMKKKSVVQYGSNRSGKPPGGYWLPQGPFGKRTAMLERSIRHYGPEGFSLQGTHRNVGYIGQNMRASRQGTPFRGVHPIGNGGSGGNYATPLPSYNVNRVIVQGDQYLYVKPSVISTRGMLRKKYKYLYNGQYPNYVVKDNYTGDKTDNASQGIYLHKLAASNTCVVDVNNGEKFEGYKARCGPTNCSTSTAKYKFNGMAANGPYTKTTKQSQDSSTHTLNIQRPCTHPTDAQKPFPVANNGNGAPCGALVQPPQQSKTTYTSNHIFPEPPVVYGQF